MTQYNSKKRPMFFFFSQHNRIHTYIYKYEHKDTFLCLYKLSLSLSVLHGYTRLGYGWQYHSCVCVMCNLLSWRKSVIASWSRTIFLSAPTWCTFVGGSYMMYIWITGIHQLWISSFWPSWYQMYEWIALETLSVSGFSLSLPFWLDYSGDACREPAGIYCNFARLKFISSGTDFTKDYGILPVNCTETSFFSRIKNSGIW